LQKNGFLLLEADPRQMKKISFLLEKRGFGEIIIAKDLSGQQRVIGGRYV
jgi:methylase of polypeptide subunit release factors